MSFIGKAPINHTHLQLGLIAFIIVNTLNTTLLVCRVIRVKQQEWILHTFFHCPAYTVHRQTLIQSLPQILPDMMISSDHK